jgi:cell migration-inducing and hyaluronan-binding protein
MAVDWVAGEQIAIASTGYNGREGEKKTIKSIDKTNANKPVITLDSPLEFKHFAATETYGSQTIDMRAEVGLLTRNVVFRGDPETSSDNEYGATIFLHS